ncbi:MAG: histidine phosphatase family protein [Pseudomonadota bacterium]
MLPSGVRLIHVRHGETDWNNEGRLQGQLDIPINATGRTQAARNGETMKAWLEANAIAADGLTFVASPLARTMETMEIVRAKLGLSGEFPVDGRLKEISFGEWSGFTYEELSAGPAQPLVRARKRDKWSFRPPGGETYGDLADRVGEWLSTVSQDTVAVSHGGVFRVLHGHLTGTPWHEVPRIAAPQDRFAVFEGDRVTLL